MTSFLLRLTKKRSARSRSAQFRENNAVRTVAAMSAPGWGILRRSGALPEVSSGSLGPWAGNWAPTSETLPKSSSPASSNAKRITRCMTESV